MSVIQALEIHEQPNRLLFASYRLDGKYAPCCTCVPDSVGICYEKHASPVAKKDTSV